jgi:hypothetical protein
VLIAPFVEEVAYYEPQSAPLQLRGTVAVVVRGSLLEEAHANGPVLIQRGTICSLDCRPPTRGSGPASPL